MISYVFTKDYSYIKLFGLCLFRYQEVNCSVWFRFLFLVICWKYKSCMPFSKEDGLPKGVSFGKYFIRVVV